MIKYVHHPPTPTPPWKKVLMYAEKRDQQKENQFNSHDASQNVLGDLVNKFKGNHLRDYNKS